MAKIEQTAGRSSVVVYTDGYPLCPEITVGDANYRGSVADLHDLKYCIERVLANIPADGLRNA
jgi:hypothetical protein